MKWLFGGIYWIWLELSLCSVAVGWTGWFCAEKCELESWLFFFGFER